MSESKGNWPLLFKKHTFSVNFLVKSLNLPYFLIFSMYFNNHLTGIVNKPNRAMMRPSWALSRGNFGIMTGLIDWLTINVMCYHLIVAVCNINKSYKALRSLLWWVLHIAVFLLDICHLAFRDLLWTKCLQY